MDFFDHIRAINNPNNIPPITDMDRRMKYWIQPKRENILVDDKFAHMTKEDFDLLTEYNPREHNVVYVGRMFLFNGEHLLWFSKHPEPNTVKNNYRKIKLTT